MAAFKFSTSATPEENIEAFLEYMESVDAEMAALLREHAGVLLPLPDEPQRRNKARAAFNRKISAGLRQLLASRGDGEGS